VLAQLRVVPGGNVLQVPRKASALFEKTSGVPAVAVTARTLPKWVDRVTGGLQKALCSDLMPAGTEGAGGMNFWRDSTRSGAQSRTENVDTVGIVASR
jgi:hypothetical protein